MKIAILDDYQHIIDRLDCFKILDGQQVQIFHESEKDPEKLSKMLFDTEILILTRERTEITETLLSKLPKLKLISQTGKISNHLDLKSCTKFRVAVAEGSGSPIAPAELAWALMMNTARQIPAAIEAMKMGHWQTNIGTSIHGKTIGIWGYGKIGQRIAGYAKAFGAKVLVWGSLESMEKAVNDGLEKAASKSDFFQTADIVSLHLRLNDQTFGIVQEIDLMQMKPTSILINTARAELIQKDALLKCLKAGHPGFAGIDVYENEPIYDTNFELLNMPNVVCTPHLGYVEKNSYELYFGKAFENAVAFINGNPVNIANPEVL